MSQNVVTPEFRVSYPSLFVPTAGKPNPLPTDPLFYSVEAIFKKGEDLSKLIAACQVVMEKKWGDKSKRPPNIRSPFRDQGERAKHIDGRVILVPPYQEGAIFMRFKSKNAPGVVDQKVQPILDDKMIYSGCWGKAAIAPYAYEVNGNRGVSFALVHFQKVRDDQPLGNRTLPEHEFAPIEVAGTSAADIFS
jgi:hypothetical protein